MAVDLRPGLPCVTSTYSEPKPAERSNSSNRVLLTSNFNMVPGINLRNVNGHTTWQEVRAEGAQII
jgi:hypothetical protein